MKTVLILVLVGLVIVLLRERPRVAKVQYGVILWYGRKERKYIWLMRK